jgi:hypothetical protein
MANLAQGKEATGIATFFNKFWGKEQKEIVVNSEDELRNLSLIEEVLERLAMNTCAFAVK